MITTPQPGAFAEIIESTVTQSQGLCWEWAHLPMLCALVKITQQQHTFFGCITDIRTGSNDPLRQPIAFKKTEAELLREQPQIFVFLQTTFTIKILGYALAQENLEYLLPPQPAKLHAFIEYASSEECIKFFAHPECLSLFSVTRNESIDPDEMLLALVRHLSRIQALNHNLIQKICFYRSTMVDTDYRKIKIFMQRLQNLLARSSMSL